MYLLIWLAYLRPHLPELHSSTYLLPISFQPPIVNHDAAAGLYRAVTLGNTAAGSAGCPGNGCVRQGASVPIMTITLTVNSGVLPGCATAPVVFEDVVSLPAVGMGAATLCLCAKGCNSMCPRLQLYAPEAATLCTPGKPAGGGHGHAELDAVRHA